MEWHTETGDRCSNKILPMMRNARIEVYLISVQDGYKMYFLQRSQTPQNSSADSQETKIVLKLADDTEENWQ